MTKQVRMYNEGNSVSSINGAGKTGQLHVEKVKLETFLNTIHKKKLKMD